MVRELIENDRIIGGVNEACAEHAEAGLRDFPAGRVVDDQWNAMLVGNIC